MRPKRLKEADWRLEEPRILAFCLDRLHPTPGARVLMRDVFKGYQEWLRERGHGKTKLSIDGFGRLFPAAYPRKVLGAIGRGIVGVELR